MIFPRSWSLYASAQQPPSKRWHSMLVERLSEVGTWYISLVTTGRKGVVTRLLVHQPLSTPQLLVLGWNGQSLQYLSLVLGRTMSVSFRSTFITRGKVSSFSLVSQKWNIRYRKRGMEVFTLNGSRFLYISMAKRALCKYSGYDVTYNFNGIAFLTL